MTYLSDLYRLKLGVQISAWLISKLSCNYKIRIFVLKTWKFCSSPVSVQQPPLLQRIEDQQFRYLTGLLLQKQRHHSEASRDSRQERGVAIYVLIEPPPGFLGSVFLDFVCVADCCAALVSSAASYKLSTKTKCKYFARIVGCYTWIRRAIFKPLSAPYLLSLPHI